MALSSYSTDAVSFIDKEGAELFQISTDKTGSYAYDTVYIKDNNSVAVSSGGGDSRCKHPYCMRTMPLYRLAAKNIL
jgi:hypothetical protein